MIKKATAPAPAKREKDPCWICEKPPVKYAVGHHVMGAQNDLDLTVDLCRGCHMLEKCLAQRKFLNNAAAVGRLITLARFHAGLPDARTFVYYEDDDSRAKMEAALVEYLSENTDNDDPVDMAHKLYEIVYPHTNQIKGGK
ncbi:MAG: hypothetical protein WC455_17195 [Dehalococcoidia bacterium]|jgi:hypothetical protein